MSDRVARQTKIFGVFIQRFHLSPRYFVTYWLVLVQRGNVVVGHTDNFSGRNTLRRRARNPSKA